MQTITAAATLAAGVRYGLELLASGAAGGGLYWRSSASPADAADPYAGGTSWSNGPIGWMESPTMDQAFELRGCQAADPK